jgi:ABC-type branched-subunit amino acid transport system ATPase component
VNGGDAGPVLAEVRHLSMAYGALKAVDNVSLEIRQSAIHGLMGPNGAGKTTLFNVISGFIRPDAGEANVGGTRLNDLPVHARIGLGITRTFQHVAIFPGLNCLENVRIGLGRNGIAQAMQRSGAEAITAPAFRDEEAVALSALAAVGLADQARTPAGLLSLGNQRRLELARAIVSRPRLLLLDEPVSGVSAEEVKKIGELLRQINRDFGITMLIVEHDIGFLASICETISVMNAGRIVAEGSSEKVLNLPVVRHIYFGDVAAA